MAKYVFLYKNGDVDLGFDDAPSDDVMVAWNNWFTSIGGSLVEFGAPFGASRQVAPGGVVSEVAASNIGGYSIIQADSMEDALRVADGCPVFVAGGNVEVYEHIDM